MLRISRLLIAVVVIGCVLEEIEIFVFANLAMKLREYTCNTHTRNVPVH